MQFRKFILITCASIYAAESCWSEELHRIVLLFENGKPQLRLSNDIKMVAIGRTLWPHSTKVPVSQTDRQTDRQNSIE